MIFDDDSSKLAWLSSIPERHLFYRKKWEAIGLDTRKTPLDSWDDFIRRVPLTSKSDWVSDQKQFPPYGSLPNFSLQRFTRCHQTSGTSGQPLRWLDSAESWGAMVKDWQTVLVAGGVHSNDRVFCAFSFGPFLGFWLAFEAAEALGCLCFAGGGMSSLLRLKVMAENQCTVLCATPTYALHLAEITRKENQFIRSIRLLVVAGEPGGSSPALRKQLSEAWNGARVWDHHGMTETGPVTHEDPNQPGNLVVMQSSFLAEVIEPLSGVSKDIGDASVEGELVLTTLSRTSTPAIRYRTGDRVRARRHGGKGHRTGVLVLEGGILGRLDDMVVIRGTNVYPEAVDSLLRELDAKAEYRVWVDRRQALPELRIDAEVSPALAPTLEDLFRRKLGLRIQVNPVQVSSLPRFEHKARRWTTLLPDEPAPPVPPEKI